MGIKHFFLILAMLCPLTILAEAETLELIIDDYPPYIDKSKDNQGFWSELVILAFRSEGIHAKLKYKPWARVELELDNNKVVSFGYVKDKKRLDKWFYSESIGDGISGFLIKKENIISWEKYEDLLQYRIGKTRGYSFGNQFMKWEPKLNIQEVHKDIQNINKIIAGRIDLYVTDIASAAMLIRKNLNKKQREGLKFLIDPPLMNWDAYLVCSKNNKKCLYYINKFNKGLRKLKKDGTYQRINDAIKSLN